MSEFKLCGIVLCGVVLCSVFKSIRNEYSIFVRICITVLVTIISLALFLPVLSYIDEITKNTEIHNYVPTLIKILGIAIISELTADICIDANENGIANKVSLFAKAEILVLTLPLIKSLFDMCQGLLKWKE